MKQKIRTLVSARTKVANGSFTTFKKRSIRNHSKPRMHAMKSGLFATKSKKIANAFKIDRKFLEKTYFFMSSPCLTSYSIFAAVHIARIMPNKSRTFQPPKISFFALDNEVLAKAKYSHPFRRM